MQQQAQPNISAEFDLQNWGMEQVAYLRRAVVDGMSGYAICSAAGVVIGFSASRNKALGAIVQNELERDGATLSRT
jgi:hypothetical protein